MNEQNTYVQDIFIETLSSLVKLPVLFPHSLCKERMTLNVSYINLYITNQITILGA